MRDQHDEDVTRRGIWSTVCESITTHETLSFDSRVVQALKEVPTRGFLALNIAQQNAAVFLYAL
jgi:hypothetical protein